MPKKIFEHGGVLYYITDYIAQGEFLVTFGGVATFGACRLH